MESGSNESGPKVSPLDGMPLFRFDERVYTLEELLAWAEYVGRLTLTLEHLQQTEESLQSGFDIDQERLQQAVNDFRYRNSLITSSETQTWLKDRSLNLDDLYTHVYRIFCDSRRHLMLTTAAWKKRCGDSFKEVWSELHFGGQFQAIMDDFVSRVAVAHAVSYDFLTPLESLEDLKLERVFLDERLWYVTELDRLYQEYCETVADRDSCQRRLNAHRLNLLKVKFEAVSYRDIHAAKEAYCCIKYDGETPDSLAERTDGAFETEFTYIEDLPEVLRQHLLSARANECLEPVRVMPQKGHTVYVLLRKTEPHLNNHEVRERLQAKIVREELSASIERNLQWLPWKIDT